MSLKILSILTYVFFFLLGLGYVWYVLTFSVNFPFQDDTCLLDFIATIKDDGTFVNFIKQLFRIDNDHSPVIPRLVSLANFFISGSLNFKAYIIIVNINIFILLVFLYLQFKKLNIPIYYFLPVPIILLQPQSWQISLWALNGLQHSLVIVFMLLAMELLHKTKRYFSYLAMLVALIATFTHGNGFLVFPVSAFILLLQKKIKDFLLWILVISGFLYFYIRGRHLGGRGFDIITTIKSFFAILGTNADVFEINEPLLSIIFGLIAFAIISLVFAKTLWKSYITKNKDEYPLIKLLYLFCFIILTAIVIALFRSQGGVVIASRFAIYASMSSIILYLVLLNTQGCVVRKVVFVIFVPISFAFCFYSYYRYTYQIDYHINKLRADNYNWNEHRVLVSLEKQFSLNVNPFLIKAYNFGLWEDERYRKNDVMNNIVEAKIDTLSTFKVSSYDDVKKETTRVIHKKIVQITSSNIPFSKSVASNALYLVLRSNTNKTYLLATQPEVQGKKTLILDFIYYKQKLTTVFNRNCIDDGKYKIGYLTVNTNSKSLIFTDKTIVFD